jgi:hypothetical protein
MSVQRSLPLVPAGRRSVGTSKFAEKSMSGSTHDDDDLSTTASSDESCDGSPRNLQETEVVPQGKQATGLLQKIVSLLSCSRRSSGAPHAAEPGKCQCQCQCRQYHRQQEQKDENSSDVKEPAVPEVTEVQTKDNAMSEEAVRSLFPPGFAPPPGLPHPDGLRPLMAQLGEQSPQAFCLSAFRRELVAILRDVASNRNSGWGVQRVRGQQVPRHYQASEFADILARSMETRSSMGRRSLLALCAGLAAGQPSAFGRKECIEGLHTFFQEIYPELCAEVPRLPFVVASELWPTFRYVFPAKELLGCLPETVRAQLTLRMRH